MKADVLPIKTTDYDNMSENEYFQGKARAVNRFADENRNKLTNAEQKFQKILLKLKIKHKAQYCVNGKFILDFYLLNPKVGVEIDGYTHLYYKQKRRDCIKEAECILKGIRVIRFTNNEVLNHSSSVAKKLVEFIKDTDFKSE